jgi:hypothetical protein
LPWNVVIRLGIAAARRRRSIQGVPGRRRSGPLFQADYFDRNFVAGLEIMLDGAEQALKEYKSRKV